MLVTDPAEVSIESIHDFDRDSDGLSDSVQIDLGVTSNSFFEILEVTVEAFSNNSLVDSNSGQYSHCLRGNIVFLLRRAFGLLLPIPGSGLSGSIYCPFMHK